MGNYIIKDPFILKSGGKKSLQNAQNHLETAELLVKYKKYGIATSHLVLAAEESIKAYVLLVESISGNEEGKDFKDLFKYHKTKQGLAGFFSLMARIFQEVRKLIFEWQFEYLDKDLTEKDRNELETKHKEKQNELKDWLINQQQKDSIIGKNATWWKHSNHLKNSGLYVDINNSTWQTPQNISKNTYKKSYKTVTFIIEKVTEFEKLLSENSELLKELYSDFLKDLDKK